MGPTGSVANKIKLMSSHHDFLIKSANYVSERIQQSLFDHKSAVSTSGDNRDIFDLLDLMNMRGKYATLNESVRVNHIEALNRIKEHGLEIEKSAPIITWLYTTVHIYDICKEVFHKLEHSNNRDKLLELNNLIESMCLPSNAVDQVKSTKIFLAILAIINEVTPHKKAKFNEEYINNKKRSLSELLNNPFYTLVNETTKKNDTLFACLDHINYLIKYPERSVTITDQLFVAALGDKNVDKGIDRADDSTSGILSGDYESAGEKRIKYIPDID
jgi:hypothetical protein